MLYGGGFWVDQFFAGDHEGVVWIHGYGNVFEKILEPGETIDIEPGGWLFRDHSVQMEPGDLRVQDRLPRRRRRQPRVQPLHRPGPRRPPERLLPPGRRGGRRRRPAAQQGGGLLGNIIGGLLDN